MTERRASVRVEVLGPLRLIVDGAAVDVPGPKRRAVLALLAIAEGRLVTVDALLDALWPAHIPESGRQALHNHMSRLRSHFGTAPAVFETATTGIGWCCDPANSTSRRRGTCSRRHGRPTMTRTSVSARLVEETGLDPTVALDETEREIIGGATDTTLKLTPVQPTTTLLGRDVQVAAVHRLLSRFSWPRAVNHWATPPGIRLTAGAVARAGARRGSAPRRVGRAVSGAGTPSPSRFDAVAGGSPYRRRHRAQARRDTAGNRTRRRTAVHVLAHRHRRAH